MIKLKIKNFIFNKLENSSYKIIAKFILIIARSILLIFPFFVRIKNFIFLIYNLLFIILFLLKKEKKDVVIVHDLLASPQTIGDFLYNYFFSIYFALLNYKVKFIIITDEYREDWDLQDYKIKKYIETITQISIKFCNNNKNFSFVMTNWDDLNKIYLNDNKYYIPFRSGIKKRFKLYTFSQNTLNFLMAIGKKNFKNDFLLDKKDFNDINTVAINKKYIAWHCRYDNSGGTPRNIDRVSFDKIYYTLKKYYKNYDILIVSENLDVIM